MALAKEVLELDERSIGQQVEPQFQGLDPALEE